MDNVPDGFADLYLRTIAQADPEAQKALCRQAIGMVQRFLEAQPHPAARSAQAPHADYQMLADWYAELSYTWLRIRHYAKENDAVKVYMWAIMLQQELNRVCDAYGLDRMPLMEHYSADNLTGFARYADQLEAAMRAIITEGGGTIHAYDSFEEFLHEV